MTKTSGTIVITLPLVMIHEIERMRGDLPRSLIYRRLLIKALGGQDE